MSLILGGLTDSELRATPVPVLATAGTAAIGKVGPDAASSDTSSRFRTSSILTLFDGKIMDAEDTLKWDTKGTGTATYTSQAIQMAVTAGQYLVRQARVFCPYFSGKSQLTEITQQSFQNEAGLVKRFGYFSSNAVAPYDSNKDGWWIEADGTTYRLICSNNGTETHNIPWTDWDAYADISSYDWSKFTVSQADFLWLGGAGLRLFLVVNGAFMLVHTIADHAGYASTLIFKSPNQPVRYEIRSTTGAGSLLAICSQVATEGATSSEAGEEVAIYTPSINCAVAGTIYALAGMRKVAAYRTHHVPVTEFGATNILAAATPESGMLLLLLNPTLSAGLTWSANSRIETGAAAAGQTVTNVGRILKAIPMSGANVAAQAQNAALRVLGVGIDNTMDQLVLAYAGYTATQNIGGYMQAIEY
jgi:hypothetical protein